jgi:hypothetical protein
MLLVLSFFICVLVKWLNQLVNIYQVHVYFLHAYYNPIKCLKTIPIFRMT